MTSHWSEWPSPICLQIWLCCRGCGEKGTLLHCWECKLVQPLWKTVWRFLKKLKIESPYDPAIPFLGIYPEKMKAIILKDTCTPMFIAALFTNSQDMETTYVSINRWMDKEDVVYIHNGILLSHKKEWNNAICSNMDAPRDYHTKGSKSDGERQISYAITYMWNLKKMIQMNLFIKQKQTHRHSITESLAVHLKLTQHSKSTILQLKKKFANEKERKMKYGVRQVLISK